jgi:hypothetical protein
MESWPHYIAWYAGVLVDTVVAFYPGWPCRYDAEERIDSN